MGAVPTTHIANGCDKPIWAMCDTNRQHTLPVSINGLGFGVKLNEGNNQNGRFIEAGKLDFDPDIIVAV
ncbi:unnamed protein product [Adineta steineri]|uniref:Uncharacterized protein n=1 Tax=Adineta steineri TaxID=433720 RepID=A0A819XTS3_9BILA|nr:unnamed protein product [Adineta steineri]CAF4140347.1 unnamed protein product [Adineta steineri]